MRKLGIGAALAFLTALGLLLGDRSCATSPPLRDGSAGSAPRSEPIRGPESSHPVETSVAGANESSDAGGDELDLEASPGRSPIGARPFARLHVRVLSAVSELPLPDLLVLVRPEDDDFSEEPDPSAPRAWTDADGTARLEVPTGDVLTVTASAQEVDCREAELDVGPVEPDERLEVELRVETKAALPFVARVLADESGEPIAGARVRLHDGDAQASASEPPLAPGCWRIDERTDADGFVELRVPSEPTLFASFEVERRPARYAPCGADHATREDAFVVRLPLAATLRVLVSESGSGPPSDLAVRALTEGFHLEAGDDVTDESSLLGGLTTDLTWEARTNASGSTELQRLPPWVPLRIELLRGETVIYREPEPLLLEPGEARELAIALGSGAHVVGRVVETFGRPVPELAIWRQKARREGLWFFGVDDPVTSEARSDADGRFAFDDVPPGDWWIGPAASRALGSEGDADAIAAVPEHVRVPEGVREIPIELVVQRGLYVRGIALDPQGEPVHRVGIWTTDFELIQSLFTFTGEDGRFELGPLVPGVYELLVDGAMAECASFGPIRARAGEELVLHMEPAAQIAGRVVGADGKPCGAVLALEWIGEKRNPMLGTDAPHARKDGRFEIGRISPGTYVLWAERRNGEVGFVEGLECASGGRLENVVVALEPSARLQVSLVGGDEFQRLCLLRDGRLLRRFYAWPKKPETLHVPRGAYTIELRDANEGAIVSRAVEVDTGETRAVAIPVPDAK